MDPSVSVVWTSSVAVVWVDEFDIGAGMEFLHRPAEHVLDAGDTRLRKADTSL
jgi:hypothetical protein